MDESKFLAVLVIILILPAIILGCFKKNIIEQTTIKINGRNLKVDVARSKDQQRQGLSGRQELDENSGMLFTFFDYQVRQFWMKDMNFPLDIIWIKDQTIVKISENVPILTNDAITTVSSDNDINKVLEVKAGWSKKNNIKIGDKIE
jgi:uncharacterized protein